MSALKLTLTGGRLFICVSISSSCLTRYSWMPVVDFTYLASPFLPDDPANMLRNGEFLSDIDVMIGATKDEGIIYLTGLKSVISKENTYVIQLDLLGGNSSTWDLFRENFNIAGTKTLFMIPFLEDMTAQDRQRTDQLVEFYLTSYDNITEQNAQAVIDLFSDSGNILIPYKNSHCYEMIKVERRLVGDLTL